MKVALVALPNPVLANPEAHFPQSLLYVAAGLLRTGHQVQIVDLRARRYITEADIPDVDCVGITCTSGERDWAKLVGRLARQKDAITMVGGAHPTFMPEDCEDFDIIVRGDGELAAVEALSEIALAGPGEAWLGTAGCGGARRGKAGRGGEGKEGQGVKTYSHPLPSLNGYSPAWELIGLKGFSKELFGGQGYGQGPLAAGIISSRGCGMRCAYCRSERDKIRLRPITEVVAEIELLKSEYGVTHFRFYDENFSNPKPRALELFKALQPLGVHIRAHTRSDAWDDELAEAYKRAGGIEMGFGFEAATDSVLEKIRKQETVEQHREAVRVCKRHGILVKAFWMVGLSGQRWAEIEDIKRFMAEERPDRWIVSVFAAYPGSDVWEHSIRYNVTYLDLDLSHYWNFPERPTIGYQDNAREDIWAQYQDLVAWLERAFPR